MLEVAIVFPANRTILYTLGVVLVYVAILLWYGLDPTSISQMVTLTGRVVTLLATAGLGTYYWRIQRRRLAAAEAQSEAAGSLTPVVGGARE